MIRYFTCAGWQSVGELVNGRWNFQSLQEHSLLSLNQHILGPFHIAGEISLGLDVSADSQVLGTLGEQWILLLLALLCCSCCCSHYLLALSDLLWLQYKNEVVEFGTIE